MVVSMKIESRERLIEFLKNTRGKRSQREYAKQLGVSATSVQDWEKGLKTPEIDSLRRIAASGGLELQEFLSYINGKTAEPDPVEEITKKIQTMPLIQVAQIAQATAARFAQDASEYKAG
jgi:transcriptional regulator with XRE-family HTH domain